MSEWKTLKKEDIQIGGNQFLEITLKKPPEGDTIFVGISKGWTTDDGEKRYKTNILFDKEKAKEIAKIIEEIAN